MVLIRHLIKDKKTMSKKIINVGNTSNDGTGDTLRIGAEKINDNFTEVYNTFSLYATKSSLNSYLTSSALSTALTPYATTASLNSLIPNQINNNGKFLTTNGSTLSWSIVNGSGTVTSVNVVSANGFAGTVTNGSSAAAITITTSVNGVLKGNGTSISAATSGTDYAPGTSTLATGIVKSTTTTGALTIAVAGTDYQAPIGTISGLVKGNGANALTAAVAGTDYALGTSTLATGIVKSTTTTGALTIAVAGTDYQAPISATGILKSSGVSGDVTAAVVGSDYQAPIGTISGLVKGNGANALTAAVAGTDYQAPLPAQTGQTGKYLTTDGTTLSWATVAGLVARSTVTATTASLANNANANADITGFKSYALLKIQTSAAAWVRIYSDDAARTADASRASNIDPASGAGIITEVITSGAQTILISPGAFGFNNESSPTTTIPVNITNLSGSAAAITVTLTILQLES